MVTMIGYQSTFNNKTAERIGTYFKIASGEIVRHDRLKKDQPAIEIRAYDKIFGDYNACSAYKLKVLCNNKITGYSFGYSFDPAGNDDKIITSLLLSGMSLEEINNWLML